MSRETLEFLRMMLAGVTLNVGAPDFPDLARKAAAAMAELDQALFQSGCDHDWTGEVCGPDNLAAGLSVRLCRKCEQADARINGDPA